MYNKEQKITIEWLNTNEKNNKISNFTNVEVSNPINNNHETDNVRKMINMIIDEEFPELKNNTLIHDLVFYNLTNKMNTVQTVENVLSCMRSNRAKKVNDVYFKNGEVCIQCSI